MSNSNNIPPEPSADQYQIWYNNAVGYVNNNVEKRLDYHQERIHVRNDLRYYWSNLDLSLPGLSESLFVVFSKRDEDNMYEFECLLLDEKLSEHCDLFVSLLAIFKTEPVTERYRDYVKMSVEKRLLHIDRETIISELLIGSWQSLSTKSIETIKQLEFLFSLENEVSLLEYEVAVLLDAPKIYSQRLPYYSQSNATMPDGSTHHGVYKLTYSTHGIQFCVINLDYLDVNIYVHYGLWRCFTPAPERTSTEDVNKTPARPAISSMSLTSTARSDHSLRSVTSKESLKPFLAKKENPLLSASPSTSIVEIATYTEKNKLASNSSIPEDFFKLWDNLNLSGLSNENEYNYVAGSSERDRDLTRSRDTEQSGEAAVMNESEIRFEQSDDFDENKFLNMFLEYKVSCDPRKMRNKRTMKKVKTILRWILQTVEQQKLLKLAPKVSELARRRLSGDEIVLLSFCDKIKNMPGSASFMIFLLRQEIADE